MTVKKWIAMITLSMLFSGTLIWEAYGGTWKQGIDGDLSAWCLYEDQFYVPSFTYGQLRYFMYEDRQKLMNSLLAADTEKHLNNPDITTMFVPLRIEDGIGDFDREQSSDGTFLYMKLKYAKTDVVTNKILRTGTFYMKLYRNKSDDIGYYIDIISNQESFGRFGKLKGGYTAGDISLAFFAPLLVWLLTLSSVMQDNWEHY